jgi:hypothetical protein
METVITVYRYLNFNHALPVKEIKWTGAFTKNPTKFAKKHGGDFIEIQSLEEYMENYDSLDLV